MATNVTLKAERRTDAGKGVARKLRASGKLPAVVYGAAADTLSLVLDTHETSLLFSSISVDNTIVNLEVEGEPVPVPTLIREIQTHPHRPDLLHVDFYRVQTGVEVELHVPIHVEGTPTGVKDQGGVLEQSLHEAPVRCVPAAIPESFVVDVSQLEIGDALRLSDLEIPEGVTILLDLERTICSVQAPTVLAVEPDEAEEEVAEGEEPELIGEEDEGVEPDAAEDEEG